MQSKILAVIVFLMIRFSATAQHLQVVFNPVAPPKEYLDAEPYGAPGSSAFIKNDFVEHALLFDTVAQKTYSGTRLVDKRCYVFAEFSDYTEFTQNKSLCLQEKPDPYTELSVERVVTLGKQQYLVYALWNLRKKEKIFYARPLNRDFSFAGEPVKVHTMPGFGSKGSASIVKASSNGRYLLFLKGNKNYGWTADHLKMECHVLDEVFSDVWSRSFDFLHRGTGRVIDEVEIDDAGNLYVLSGTLKKIFKNVVDAYSWRDQELREIPLTAGDQTSTGGALRILNGHAVAIGLFRERRQYGYNVFSFDDHVAHEKSTQLFSPGVMEHIAKIENDYHSHYAIRKVVRLSNGDIVFSMEDGGCSSGPNQQICFARAAIIASWNGQSLSADTKARWDRLIYKKQQGSMLENEHSLIPVGDQVLVLYNDAPDNLDKSPDDKKVTKYNGEKTGVTVQRIDVTGEAKKEMLPIVRGTRAHSISMPVTRISDDLYFTRLYMTRVGVFFGLLNIGKSPERASP